MTVELDPDAFEVGEMLDGDGHVGLMLGFEVDGYTTRYRLHPTTAIEIVRAMSGWLDRHSEGRA